MFYESIGAQLSQVSEALAADDPSRELDERGRRERRQMTTLLRRIGAIWPDLFCALKEESAILDATRRGALEAVRAKGLIAPGENPGATASDPLERYRQLLCEIDELVILLHTQRGEAWAAETLRTLRGGLAEAAKIQGRLVDAMLAA
ncbi:MAG: hypothetical protein GY910_28605 [bacterium]|nr:hypothetical protein [Deltaproteobacteria bacterium]MCP4908958.1 hypothetical protein [bacterium]